MTHFVIEKTVEVPKNIKVDMKQIRGGFTVKIEGPKGNIEKSFTRISVNISYENKSHIEKTEPYFTYGSENRRKR